MKGAKKLQAEIIKMLPDEWNYQDKLKFFEDMAETYRKKSRNDVYNEKAKSVIRTDDNVYLKAGKG